MDGGATVMNQFIITAAVVRLLIDVATVAALAAWSLDKALEKAGA